LCIICSTTDENWNYHNLGPDVWSDAYPSCAEHSQSPINIRTACTIYQPHTPFHFSSTYEIHFVHTSSETSEIAALSIFMQSNQNTKTKNVYNTRNITIMNGKNILQLLKAYTRKIIQQYLVYQ